MKYEEHFSPDPELEARIVAWVLGETSPFEAAELERRIADDPELAAFTRRIEAVHGLVGEAVKPAPMTFKLSAERRAKLLAAIGAPAKTDPGSVMALKPLGAERRWRFPVWVPAVAATLVVGFVIFHTSRQQDARVPRLEKAAPVTLSLPRDSEMRLREEAAGESKREAELLMAQEAKKRKEQKAMVALGPAGGGGPEPLHPVDLADAPPEGHALNAYPQQMQPAGAGVALSTVPRGEFNLPSASNSLLNSASSGGVAVGGNFAGNISANGALSTSDAATITFKSQRFGYGSYGTTGSTGTVTLSAPATIVTSGGNVPASADHYIDNDENLVKLSPFEVRASAEQGYTASSTLAGTRVNSSLKDVGTAPSVLSKALTWNGASQKNVFGYIGTPAGQQDGKPAAANEDFLAFPADAAAKTPAEADLPVAHPAPPAASEERTETKAQQQSVSTFSFHVGDASFRLAQAALARGERPDPASIRPEEFYNAFDYGDPAPGAGEPVACRIEQSAHPVLQQRNFLRIALRVPAAGRAAAQPLRLTVLLDTSGSMEREDRRASVTRAMEALVSLLGPQDQVTLIGFARQPRLIAERVTGADARRLVDLIARTPAEGGTNMEEALKLAAEKARAQFDPHAQNRIVVLSDGAANLGNDDPAQLANTVAALRQQGISFDACGVGIRGLDDSVLEALTRKGDGRYYVINSAEEADAQFARKLAGALRPAAENVKVQVRFNPARVQSYRLIGFEQHRLREEDFRNDKVTAAELAGDEAAVALYEVQANPEGNGELGEVFVRFRDTNRGGMVERSWTLLYDPRAPAFDRASPSMQLAGTAALLAEKLQAGDPAQQIRLAELAPIVNQLRGHYAHDERVQAFLSMFAQARRLHGE